jgi:hypothetical protein
VADAWSIPLRGPVLAGAGPSARLSHAGSHPRHVRQVVGRLQDCTCVETVARFRKGPRKELKLVDHAVLQILFSGNRDSSPPGRFSGHGVSPPSHYPPRSRLPGLPSLIAPPHRSTTTRAEISVQFEQYRTSTNK